MTREERRHRIGTLQKAIERHYREIHELEKEVAYERIKCAKDVHGE